MSRNEENKEIERRHSNATLSINLPQFDEVVGHSMSLQQKIVFGDSL